MVIASCILNIGEYRFDFVNEIEIESAWNKLTDTATIQQAQNISWKDKKLRQLIAVGNPVQIEIGYGSERDTVFSGYITELAPGVPIKITCEDEMWQLKQSSVTDNISNATITDLLNQHFSGYPHKALPVNLGSSFIIDGVSKAKILKQLNDDFGIHCFFRQGTLYAGRIYDTEYAETSAFRLGYNIIEDDLIYKRKDDVKLSVTAISNNPDGSKLEVKLGDAEGEQRTLNFYNLKEADLRSSAEREIDRLKYDGYRGSFTAFGRPLVRHGHIVEFQDVKDSDRAGRYWVDAVTYTLGTSGVRQKITLGPRA